MSTLDERLQGFALACKAKFDAQQALIGQSASSFLGFLSQPTGHFFVDQGAHLLAVADRQFVGDAAKNLGTNTASQLDWLTTFQLARGRANGSLQSAQFGATNSTSTIDASNAVVAAAQNGPLGVNYNAVGLTGIGVSNNGGVGAGMAWGLYTEAYRYGTGSNGGYSAEHDIINFVGAVTLDPFTQTVTQTVGVQIGSGGQFSSGLFDASAAINVRKNGASFLSGIIFGSDAITLTGGIGEAIAFGKGHKEQWYGAAATKTSSIYCDGTTTAGGSALHFGEGLVELLNSVGNPIARWNSITSGVNYPSFSDAVTGSPAQIAAAGSDTNVGILLAPKGTAGASVVQIPIANVQTFANDAAAATGGVPVGGIYRNASTVQIRVS
jgi:hypothetical protein